MVTPGHENFLTGSWFTVENAGQLRQHIKWVALGGVGGRVVGGKEDALWRTRGQGVGSGRGGRVVEVERLSKGEGNTGTCSA